MRKWPGPWPSDPPVLWWLGRWVIQQPMRLKSAEERGNLFYGPGVAVYEGMVIGENARPGDIPINVCRKKHLTNVRSSRGDMEIRLTPPRQMSIDEAIEYLADDELLEVTPLSYRIRKRILNTDERGKQQKKAKDAQEE